ncbi:MAG: T9SS type A sorting domain-containing protein [Bacteroidales bacterium]|nr:T9SS type A sorting domain-containing protein [Bacteroidales bacterium]
MVEVSVLETENIYTFTVYPNPAQHTIFIKTPDGGAADFLLSDLQGKILLKGFSNQINIQNLKSGVYIIKINGIVKKVVKI